MMTEIIETIIGSFLFGIVLVLLCRGAERIANKQIENSFSLTHISKPELLWLKFKPKETDRAKGFVLIGSWTIAVILFGMVMLYG